MLDYAWRVVTTRVALWIVAAGCALLVALPGSFAALYLMGPLTALALTGDAALAVDLAPAPFDRLPVAAAAALIGALAGLALWSRLYAAAVWVSDDRHDGGLGSAFRSSRRSWRTVFVLYAGAYGALAAGAGLAIAMAGLAGSDATALTLALAAGAALLAGRAFLRSALTLAVRATVLDGEPVVTAWARGITVLRSRMRAAVAAWIALLAMGAVVWIGGRLISPVLQDTALDYPPSSLFVAYREIAQLALAVPLESLLLTLSLGVWTALYTGHEENPGASSRATRDAARDRGANPWVVKALVVLVALTVLANGIPTVVDRAWSRREDRAEALIESDEIEPQDAVRSAVARPRPPSGATYEVKAALDGGRLAWTTDIDFFNDTGETLGDLGLHVYPAAYTRDVPRIPLGRDLLDQDLSGEFRAQARPGTIAVERVAVDGTEAPYSRDETDLLIDLPSSLRPGGRATVEIRLSGRLPAFPERFGVWDGMTLLGNWIPVIALRSGGRWRLDGYPSIGDPFVAAAADYRVSIEADAQLSVAGSGVLASVLQDRPGRRIWTFVANDVRDAAFVAAPFLRGLEGSSAGVTVRSWYSAEDRTLGDTHLRAAVSALADYARRFGPLPFDEVEVVATKGLLGGMEYPGVVFASDTSKALAGTPLLPELTRHSGFEEARARYLIGHEIAHQWWYASVGSDQLNEPWLDEALAEVSTRLWLESTEGNDRTWKMAYLVTESQPRAGVVGAGVDEFSSNEDYTDAVYIAGAAVLMELRAEVGGRTFEALLREWHERTRLEIGTISGFIATVEAVAGRRAATMVERYR